MIEKLEHYNILENSGYGGPSFNDVIDKINELVEAVNRLEKQIEKLQVL